MTLRKLFGPKREKVWGNGIKLQKGKLLDQILLG
jgi:hypothetical protein